jgi:hypothetical protein
MLRYKVNRHGRRTKDKGESMLHEFLHNFLHNLFKPLLLFFYFGFLIRFLKVAACRANIGEAGKRAAPHGRPRRS